jgi:hypothetical protein
MTTRVRSDLNKKVATSVYRDVHDDICIKYHTTIVVRITRRGVFLDSGGWETVTTKRRMNQASDEFDLGFYVFQKNFDWFVSYKGEEIPFESGMELY